MLPFGAVVATILGVIVLFVMKTYTLNRYAWPKQEWQKWVVATVAGLAVNTAVRVLLK